VGEKTRTNRRNDAGRSKSVVRMKIGKQGKCRAEGAQRKAGKRGVWRRTT
jgi:hypothetical protein